MRLGELDSGLRWGFYQEAVEAGSFRCVVNNWLYSTPRTSKMAAISKDIANPN